MKERRCEREIRRNTFRVRESQSCCSHKLFSPRISFLHPSFQYYRPDRSCDEQSALLIPSESTICHWSRVSRAARQVPFEIYSGYINASRGHRGCPGYPSRSSHRHREILKYVALAQDFDVDRQNSQERRESRSRARLFRDDRYSESLANDAFSLSFDLTNEHYVII